MTTRRNFLKTLGASAAVAPFLTRCESLRGAEVERTPQRLIFVFSPNGTIPTAFWPDEPGELKDLKPILKPFEPYRDRLMTLKGISNRIRGDGDSHMRGMSCLLTGIELFPGNIQGGSHTPAGWAKGISIDQEIKNHLQSDPETQTRFGSLEFGVAVPNRADPWTRWVYAGPNKPVAPITDPYRMYRKLYGQVQDQESLSSILDLLQDDLAQVGKRVSSADRHLLEEHQQLVREMENELVEAAKPENRVTPVEIAQGVKDDNDNIPQLTKMQTDMLVHALQTDMTRIATLQFTRSVGQARMKWLGIDEGHHALSHDPDLNTESSEKLTKINTWFSEQIAELARRLDEIPEPNAEGSMLDHTMIVWTNELGKGNSHTLDDIPFVLLGGGMGFEMGKAHQYDRTPHNRLLLSLANGMGHPLETFGNPQMCEGGMLTDL